MLETAAARWASAGNLRPLLEGMPKLVHLLGFEFYLFTSQLRSCTQTWGRKNWHAWTRSPAATRFRDTSKPMNCRYCGRSTHS